MEDSNSVAETIHDEQQSAKDADSGRLHEAALEDVLGVVLEHWQYPRRSFLGTAAPAKFDLKEWLSQEFDGHRLATLVCGLIDDSGTLNYETKTGLVMKLKAHLSTSDIVAERVAVLRAEERNES